MSDQGYYKNGFQKLKADTHAWRTVANAVPYVIPYLKKSDKLLDVGLGPGTILKDFANYVGQVIGIEPTQELIDLASQQEGLPSLVLFQVALAYDLPFPDNSFDVVHALQVVIHLLDPIVALKEMYRVCKPGGYVCVKDGDLTLCTVYPQVYEKSILPFFQKRAPGLSTLNTAGRMLKERAIEAGFDLKRINFSALVYTGSSDDERAFWADMYIKRILQTNEFDFMDRELVETMVDGFRRWKSDECGVLMIVNGEVVCQK